ncbi:MAG: FkbM family methyltransferase, partial [Actinomycetota bacterium]
MSLTKRIGLVGRQFTVSGSPKDDYFRGLPEGSYNDPVLTGLLPYIGDEAVCIDVGANIGLYSLALSVLAPGGRIYAFEPSRDAFNYLQENLAQNRAANVAASQLALGNSTGSVRFHEIPFFTAGSFTVDESCFLTSEILGSTFFEAPCTTLDEFVRSEGLDRLDLVKIDVEGGEMSVIEGALQTIEQHHPLVVLEFSSFALTLNQSILPQVALERLNQIFPYIFVIGRTDGLLRRVSTGNETYDFLYDNGIHGPVDNLLCCHDDLDVSRGYIRLAAQAAEAALTAAEARPTEAAAPQAPVEPPRTQPPRTLSARVLDK